MFQPRPRVDRRQRQPGPGHIVFRPNLGSINGGGKTGVTGALTGAQGHKFSASQVINTRLMTDVWCLGQDVTSVHSHSSLRHLS